MVSEIELCRELWKYEAKKSLPRIAHLRCRKERISAAAKRAYTLPQIMLHRYWKTNFTSF
jgi:hypothetical protein